MILPRDRLIWLTAAVVPPFAALAAIGGPAAAASLSAMGLLAAAAVADALLSARTLAGVDVSLPPVVRTGQGRESMVAVTVTNPEARNRELRLGVCWPEGIESPHSAMDVALPKGAEMSVFSWPYRALGRGRHLVSECRLEAASPLGLWARRERRELCTEIRSYPDLRREKGSLAGLFTRRGVGLHTRRQMGKGREFEQLREYVPGDSYEDIHWKAMAKRDRPVTKLYRVERTQQIYAVLDASRHSARAVQGPDGEETNLFERFLSAALVLGLAAGRQGDLFGVLSFSDRVDRFVRAGSGKAHYDACRDALFSLPQKDVMPDFSELFSFMGTRMRRRSLVVFLTSLDDDVTMEAFTRNVEMVARRHLVLSAMPKPVEARPMFGRDFEAVGSDPWKALAGHFQNARLKEMERGLARKGVLFALLDTEKMCAQVVSRYLEVKKRQVL